MKNQLIEIFESDDGEIKLEVNLEQEMVWLTQKQMADLFQRDRTVILRHIDNVFEEKELDKKVVCANFAHTTRHGAIKGKTQIQTANVYNLDVIISVGYRVKSQRGVQFRKWATSILKDHLIKGYSANTNRLLEQKLVLEIKESSKIVEQILSLKGIRKNSSSQIVIDTVSLYLGKAVDQETMILKNDLKSTLVHFCTMVYGSFKS